MAAGTTTRFSSPSDEESVLVLLAGDVEWNGTARNAPRRVRRAGGGRLLAAGFDRRRVRRASEANSHSRRPSDARSRPATKTSKWSRRNRSSSTIAAEHRGSGRCTTSSPTTCMLAASSSVRRSTSRASGRRSRRTNTTEPTASPRSKRCTTSDSIARTDSGSRACTTHPATSARSSFGTARVVGIPHGYHPVAAAPGYRLYYLWALVGARRQLAMHEDPAHRWLHDSET